MTETTTPQYAPLAPLAAPPALPAALPPWRRRLVAATVAAALAVTGGAGGGLLAAQIASAAPAATATTFTTTQVASTGTPTLTQVAAEVAPSVVTVLVSGVDGSAASGSGVVLSEDGLILTNNHVVESGGSVRVTLADGRTVDATVVGRDPATDLAVLRAEGVSGLTPAALGSSASLEVGDTVLAFGSPLGLEGTVTSGIVSALGRTIEDEDVSLSGLIQTDAPINAGSSGGPLVDASGQVVGITVAIATTSEDGGNIGVGFAIPIDTAAATATHLAS